MGPLLNFTGHTTYYLVTNSRNIDVSFHKALDYLDESAAVNKSHKSMK